MICLDFISARLFFCMALPAWAKRRLHTFSRGPLDMRPWKSTQGAQKAHPHACSHRCRFNYITLAYILARPAVHAPMEANARLVYIHTYKALEILSMRKRMLTYTHARTHRRSLTHITLAHIFARTTRCAPICIAEKVLYIRMQSAPARIHHHPLYHNDPFHANISDILHSYSVLCELCCHREHRETIHCR
jgi:hypothetical protein